MTATPMEMLVFKDGEGHYYVLTRQAWEQARVPDERRHEVDKILASGAAAPASAKKIGDLPPRDVKAVRGGATSTQMVGTYRTSSPIGTSPTSPNWNAPPTSP
jgi:hypothetical protein